MIYLTCVYKVLQSTCVVHMQMAKHYGLDIADIVPGGSNSGRETVFFLNPYPGRTFNDMWIPILDHILATATVKEEKAFLRMVHQECDHHEIASAVWCQGRTWGP